MKIRKSCIIFSRMQQYILISCLYLISVAGAYYNALHEKFLPMSFFLCVMIVFPIYKILLLKSIVRRDSNVHTENHPTDN
jgi:hypothetical protein